MPNLTEIQEQIAKLPGAYVFFTKKEIRALPKILGKDEYLLALTSGMMNNRTWLGVCTPSRVIFLNCGMIFGLRQVQIPLERIQSIDNSYDLVFGSIRVWDGASYFTLSMVLKSSVEPFVRAVSNAMDRIRRPQKESAAKTAPGTAGPADVATQLEKLAALYEKGYLSAQEFEQQKQRLLDS